MLCSQPLLQVCLELGTWSFVAINRGIPLSRTSVRVVYTLTNQTSRLRVTGKCKGCDYAHYLSTMSAWGTQIIAATSGWGSPSSVKTCEVLALYRVKCGVSDFSSKVLKDLCVLPKNWYSPYMEASVLPEQASFLLIRQYVITKATCNDIYEMWILDLFCTDHLIFLSKAACYANSEDC